MVDVMGEWKILKRILTNGNDLRNESVERMIFYKNTTSHNFWSNNYYLTYISQKEYSQINWLLFT